MFIISGLILFAIIIAAVLMSLRRVVPPNEVHILQNSKTTVSYGKDKPQGNVYYEWPSWMPVLGVTTTILPVSVFDLSFDSYEAYDKERVPFVVDIVSFFRVEDSNIAAQRVESFRELQEQLVAIVRGAIRATLAAHHIDDIMLERTKFSEQFTSAIEEQLRSWGVATVKNIELMDVRDAQGSQVVHNIMEKKKSLIEMESRVEVAENKKKAEIAEINAKRDTEIQSQLYLQKVGQQEADRVKAVGLSNESAKQAISEQAKITREKEMAVKQVNDVQQAIITKEVNIVKAEEEKQSTILIAQGDLENKRLESEGIDLEGKARANAKREMELAPIKAQIELAKEIGENVGYQNYLTTIKQIEAAQAIGISQAEALKAADIKIINNSGTPTEGITNVMDLFTAKGGTSIAGMLEAINQSPEGEALLDKLKGKFTNE